MRITRNAEQPSRPGAVPDNFTGVVRVDNPSMPEAPGRAGTATVTFAPGARTVWHTHPAGQTIVILAGRGRVQKEGGPIVEVSPGDTVFFEAGEKHWHGATADVGMSHLAVTETVDGKAVDWLEPVSDEQYGAVASTSR